MSAKIKIELDTKQAMASADVLEARLRKVSSAAADLFRKAGPTGQTSLLKAYGIDTRAGPSTHGGIWPNTVGFDESKFRAASRIQSPMLPSFQANLEKLKKSMQQNPGGIDWRKVLLGTATSFFSPWLGARMLNESGLLKGLAGGMGGKVGGIAKALFGGSTEGFAENYLLIQSARALDAAFRQLTEAVKRSSDLYLKSAMLGTNPTNLSHIQKAFSMVGFSPEIAQRMMAQGQFRAGVKISSSQAGGVLLGAGAGILSREELQGIMNMSQNIARAWNMTADSARQSASTAADLYRVSFIGKQFKEEWNTFWEQFAAEFSGVVSLFEMSATGLLHAINRIIELMRKIPASMSGFPSFVPLSFLNTLNKAVAYISPVEDPNKFKRFGMGQGMSRPESAWERMGLVIHGGIGGQDFAKQTAENTKVLADYVKRKGAYATGEFLGESAMRNVNWNIP